MSEDEIVEIHAMIKGYVQGVGFRMTAREHARRFGLAGTVRNLSDGSVEIYVLGKRKAVDAFFNYMRTNAGFGEISEILSQEVFPRHAYVEFKIIH
jgi:acylphosphatase